jgi:hypothetical protein
MHWFFHNGMSSIYLNQNNEEILSKLVPEPEEDVGDLGFVSDAIRQARLVNLFFFFLIYHFI